MFYALAHYPQIKHEGFQSFRRKYDPYSELLDEHVTFIFPVPEVIGREKLEAHIEQVLAHWEPFRVHFCTLEINWDHWMYLGAKEGHDLVVKLHDDFYQGLLGPYLREDLPFFPHIGLGLFSKERYDFNNPTAELRLDEEKYKMAVREFEALGFEIWFTVDRFTLVQINADFTEFHNLKDFNLI
jgi:hypothetical protein